MIELGFGFGFEFGFGFMIELGFGFAFGGSQNMNNMSGGQFGQQLGANNQNMNQMQTKFFFG